jgi:hypothetical protein
MTTEDDIAEVVDEIADDVNPPRLAGEAERLGITAEELLAKVTVEVLSRLA